MEGPLSTSTSESEALWEQCLPMVSLSAKCFSRLKCFNNLKYSYQKLNIWKPKSPIANRQLSACRAHLHSPTHFPLNTVTLELQEGCSLILKCIKFLPKKQTSQYLWSSQTRKPALHGEHNSKPSHNSTPFTPPFQGAETATINT